MIEKTQKRQRIPYYMTLLLLSLLLLLAVIVSFGLGRYPISLRELLGILAGRGLELLDLLLSRCGSLLGLEWEPGWAVAPFWDQKMELILFNVRLPRILLACLVGCSLSAAGAAYQGVFQNPMAAPDILGASSGAAFGAALAILFALGSRLITLLAFGMSLLTVFLVWFVSERAKGQKVLSLILAGIMVSSLFSAGTSFIKLVADPYNQLPAITYWLMGSLSGARLSDVGLALVPMACGLLPLYFLRWRINVLTLGDDEARSIGVNARRVRLTVIACSTLVTAAAVAVSGMIGWVGLVIPHLCRRLVGNNYRELMPASMLAGALFLLVVDNVSRNLLAVEIPIGILTAFIGAPFFVYLITQKGGDL